MKKVTRKEVGKRPVNLRTGGEVVKGIRHFSVTIQSRGERAPNRKHTEIQQKIHTNFINL